MSFIFLFSPKSNERNVKQRPACLGAVICDWRLGRRRVGLGDHLQRVVIDRLRGSGGWVGSELPPGGDSQPPTEADKQEALWGSMPARWG